MRPTLIVLLLAGCTATPSGVQIAAPQQGVQVLQQGCAAQTGQPVTASYGGATVTLVAPGLTPSNPQVAAVAKDACAVAKGTPLTITIAPAVAH